MILLPTTASGRRRLRFHSYCYLVIYLSHGFIVHKNIGGTPQLQNLLKAPKQNRKSNVPFESFFQLDANTRTRGHSVKLKKKSFHTELRQHFFSERVINLWNSLDEETVTASSLNSFKNHLIRQRKHMKIGHVLGK